MANVSGFCSQRHQKAFLNRRFYSPGNPTPGQQSTGPLIEGLQGLLLPEGSRVCVKLTLDCTFYFKVYVHK
jgi:hypothetical protein